MAILRELPELPGVEHRFVDVEGLRMHVALAGQGEAIVLLHGWPQHWWQWRHIIPALAEHHRVICPDLRGLGWTDAPPIHNGPAMNARDVLGLLDRLGVHRFGLIGHDWGGAAGYLLALSQPDRVTGYLALNTASPFLRASPDVLRNSPHLWHIPANGFAPKPIANWALRNWIHRDNALDQRDRAIFLAQFGEPARIRTTKRYYRHAVGKEIPLAVAGKYRWTRLRVPTVVMAGDRDPLLPPEQMLDLGGYATNWRAERLAGVGHFPADEAPEAVTQAALSLF